MSEIRTVYHYEVDLERGTQEVTLHRPLTQLDALADRFDADIRRGNAPVDVSGMTAHAYLFLSGGDTAVALRGETCGSVASVVLGAGCYATPGHASLVLQITDGDVRHTVLRVNLRIAQASGDRAVAAPDVIPSLPELLDRIDAMAQATADARHAAAAANCVQAEIQQVIDQVSARNDEAERELHSLRGKVDALVKVGQGITHDFVTDNDVAYRKIVPSGAELAAVEAIGGRTVVWNQQYDIAQAPMFPEAVQAAGVTFTPGAEGTVRITGGCTNSGAAAWYELLSRSCLNGGRRVVVFGHGTNTILRVSDGVKEYDTEHTAIIPLSGPIERFSIGVTEAEIDTVCAPRIVDLTLMYGAGHEPASIEDPRIAWIVQYAAAAPAYNAGTLVSAAVERVRCGEAVPADLPESVRELPGYGCAAGDVCNSIERTESGWQYVQRVDSVDLSSLDWSYDVESLAIPTFKTAILQRKMGVFSCVCAKYPYLGARAGLQKSDGIAYRNETTRIIHIRDDAYTNVPDFRAAVNGVKLCYELQTPITTDVTGLMADWPDCDAVAAGGIITLENAAALALPSRIKYLCKLSEVVA